MSPKKFSEKDTHYRKSENHFFLIFKALPCLFLAGADGYLPHSHQVVRVASKQCLQGRNDNIKLEPCNSTVLLVQQR